MKNLKLSSHVTHKLDSDKVWKICLNPIQNEVYAVSKYGIHILQQKSSLHREQLFCEDQWASQTSTLSQVISMDYVASINCFCVTFAEGDILTANIEDQFVDTVGSVTDGIQCATWSPDQELLVIISGASVILMTTEFEPICEVSLEQEDFGEHKFVNVGWGKKETQFQGSAGKQLAKSEPEKKISVFEWDDRMPRTSWRGDGQLFAVSYVSQVTLDRKFRVINREGIIQFTSESIEGLEQSLFWRPSGNLIASSQRLSNKHNIVFFEKNGLQHGQFKLPIEVKEMIVHEVSWNADSSILLIWLQPFSSNTESILQFWSVNNYHWYLKEEIKLNDKIVDFCWDIDQPFVLHVLTSHSFHKFEFTWIINHSLGQTESDLAQVAVVDGNKILLTMFRQAIIPPPLSACEVNFCNQVHAVMFAPASFTKEITSLDDPVSVGLPANDSNNICIFHGEDSLTFLTCFDSNVMASNYNGPVSVSSVGVMSKTILHKVHSQYKVEVKNICNSNDSIAAQTFNWLWVSPSIIVSAYVHDCDHFILIYNIIGSADGKIVAEDLVKLPEEIFTITLYDPLNVCLQLKSGHLLLLNLSDKSLTPWVEEGKPVIFPYPCEKVIFCPLDCGNMILGLSRHAKLYLGNIQLLSDCTSMHLHSDHLLLTTTSHKMVIVPLLVDSLKSLSKEIKDTFTEIGTRNLERGSRLVTAVPSDTKVVLQMPRGNLESISPRSIVVHALIRLLDAKDYLRAVDMMRRHRIDMNLIYDHNPELFLTNIEQYVKKVENPNWIDLFIACLNNDDITKTAYSCNYRHDFKQIDTFEKNKDKIDLLSNALRKAMIAVDEEKYLLPILTTYVKQSKENMYLALMKLKDMKESGKQFKVSFEDGLRHLTYVSDVNELCDVALGTYDFDLVMLVFEKSQKDPKEYIPFLNNLKNLEPDYQKFKINVHLKRYRKALESLINYERHGQECIELIKKEKLYSEALEIFANKSSFYKSVCSVYGDYLLSKGYDNEAATMYSRAGDLQSALNAYERVGNWRRALIVAFQLNFNKMQINNLCYSLIEKLKEKDLFCEAAIIFESYLQNEEDAVECLTKGYQWEEAFLLASKMNRNDLIDVNIKPSIHEYYRTLTLELQQKETLYSQLFTRLLKVRTSKMTEYVAFLEGKENHELDSELCSDSSTVTGFSHQRSQFSMPRSNVSSQSGKSYRSSKNKRKLDRKKYSTKEGSNFEDVGLIVALHEIMVSVDSLTKSVSDLNRALLSIGDDRKAEELQRYLDKLLQEVKKRKFEIWINCAPPQDDAVEFGPEMTAESVLRHMSNGELSSEAAFIIKRMGELEPHFRYPPLMENSSNWKIFSIK